MNLNSCNLAYNKGANPSSLEVIASCKYIITNSKESQSVVIACHLESQ